MALNGLLCTDVLRLLDLVPLTEFTYKYRPVYDRSTPLPRLLTAAFVDVRGDVSAVQVWLALADNYLNGLCIDWEKTKTLAFNRKSNPEDNKLDLQIVKVSNLSPYTL